MLAELKDIFDKLGYLPNTSEIGQAIRKLSEKEYLSLAKYILFKKDNS